MPHNLRAEHRGALQVRGERLPWGARTFVMGIVNVTPDSFSCDGVVDPEQASEYARAQAQLGADMLDIGAESTRPGHTAVPAAMELARLLPVLERVRAALPAALLSVDTYKAAVFRRARAAGADILNCVWGLPDDLLEVAAQTQTPVVIMHNKVRAEYAGDVMDDVLSFLESAAQRAVAAGIPREHVIVDPGIGFGKTAEHNVRVLHELPRVVSLGFPTLLGASRKSTLGKLTGKPVNDRVAGTTATTALAVAAGIDIVRVHDVNAAIDAVRVCDAVVRGWRPASWIG